MRVNLLLLNSIVDLTRCRYIFLLIGRRDRAALLATDDLQLVMRTMMKISGGSVRFGHEVSLSEFIKQSEDYQELDQDSLNQVYKFLLYNGVQGVMLSHPFPAEQLHFLREWASSEDYQQIKAGNYSRVTEEGSVDVPSSEAASEVEPLR